MDHLFSPWRFRYVAAAKPEQGCVFCLKGPWVDDATDRANFVLARGEHCFALLNIYPYTGGHLMVVPYAHVATLNECGNPALEEIMRLTATFEAALQKAYRPGGINIGMNVGAAAGAGVAGHIHMHVLPRWVGDVNFMTTIAETRVIPEDLEDTYEKLKAALEL